MEKNFKFVACSFMGSTKAYTYKVDAKLYKDLEVGDLCIVESNKPSDRKVMVHNTPQNINILSIVQIVSKNVPEPKFKCKYIIDKIEGWENYFATKY